ncbi:hypothetical protein EOA33_24315 [Mesorhizobium sp. M4A.F.Ca.ET.050.02.1.1]|uniref:hypothetical protein n=1 Tax=Mesorhizobium sp. M4A.F.Ca.ET.050.02.1.1 TaxID=2496754 RepID=UPI000FCB8FCE|nr:hypothetical protein [Mesorhizobium sp. M4A.F.Ca.ET.050.02.1.1]RUX45347.1 hypothetical protein EOA33_24315 [Mesorhizobium sp. M4A.F.Ca.ET.050.02.1.1]
MSRSAVWHPFTQHATEPVPPTIVRTEGAYVDTRDAVNREILIAVIDEARAHPVEQPYGPISVTQKQGASV